MMVEETLYQFQILLECSIATMTDLKVGNFKKRWLKGFQGNSMKVSTLTM